jgi:hypothetical protein
VTIVTKLLVHYAVTLTVVLKMLIIYPLCCSKLVDSSLLVTAMFEVIIVTNLLYCHVMTLSVALTLLIRRGLSRLCLK